MDDGTEIVKRIAVEEKMDEYVSFFDPTWAEEFLISLRMTKLDPYAIDLVFDWKAAAYTAAMPWLLVRAIPDFLKGYSSVPQMVPTAMPSMTPSDIWSKYRQNRESNGFNIILWGSQRICYGAIYHAYENFLVSCLVASGKSDYRPMKKKGRAPWQVLKDDLNMLVAKIGDECLEDENVFLARLVRNALDHKGGRTNREIESRNTCMQIEDGFVQIRPVDTRNLFNLLKHKASRVAEVTHALPVFLSR